jgi:hypothetical protein
MPPPRSQAGFALAKRGVGANPHSMGKAGPSHCSCRVNRQLRPASLVLEIVTGRFLTARNPRSHRESFRYIPGTRSRSPVERGPGVMQIRVLYVLPLRTPAAARHRGGVFSVRSLGPQRRVSLTRVFNQTYQRYSGEVAGIPMEWLVGAGIAGAVAVSIAAWRRVRRTNDERWS